MEVVDSLTPKILRKVHVNLKELIRQGIVSAVREYGPGDVIPATSLIPCTTLAKCVATLLRRTRSEVNELQQQIGLRESLASLPLLNLPESKALFEHLTVTPLVLLVDKFTDLVFDELEQWRERWMKMGRLADLTEEDMELVRKAVNELPEDDEETDTVGLESEDGSGSESDRYSEDEDAELKLDMADEDGLDHGLGVVEGDEALRAAGTSDGADVLGTAGDSMDEYNYQMNDLGDKDL